MRNKNWKSDTRLYKIWVNMRQRCNNKSQRTYHLYGGRGIKVCARWNTDFDTFHKWAITNGYQDNLSLDRVDNDKGYMPSNCRWATQKEQNNNKRSNVSITYKGKTQNMKQWSEELSLNYSTLRNRRRNGWSIEEMFEIAMEGRAKGGSKKHWERKLR